MDKEQAINLTNAAHQSRLYLLEDVDATLDWLQKEYKKLGLKESEDLIENARICIKGVRVLEIP